MSAYAYGALMRRGVEEQRRADRLGADESGKPAAEQTPQEKMANAVSALIPADVLTLHALVVSLTTSTDSAGTTTITQERFLGGMFIMLLVVTAVVYLVGRGRGEWTPADWVRLAIPLLAFVAWTALLGTSALTPWISLLARSGVAIPSFVLVVAAAVLGVIILALNDRVNPKKKAS